MISQMYDTDRSGCISKEELASMLRVRAKNPAKRLLSSAARIYFFVLTTQVLLPRRCRRTACRGDITEPGKLDEMFDEMDANSDGKVTFDEFKAAMQKDSSLQDVVLSSLRPAP